MIDPYITYMWEHPPRRIAPLACAADETVAAAIADDYGNYTTVFGTRCPCGCSDVEVYEQRSAHGSLTGVGIHCAACGQDVIVFDPASDGWDGALGFRGDEATQQTKPVRCPNCGASLVRLFVAFQYSGDGEELDDPEHLSHKEDFFGWFVAYMKCETCSKIREILSYECA